MIATHVRNMDVLYYNHKTVYVIPLHDDIVHNKKSLKINNNDMELTLWKLPPQIKPRWAEEQKVNIPLK